MEGGTSLCQQPWCPPMQMDWDLVKQQDLFLFLPSSLPVDPFKDSGHPRRCSSFLTKCVIDAGVEVNIDIYIFVWKTFTYSYIFST